MEIDKEKLLSAIKSSFNNSEDIKDAVKKNNVDSIISKLDKNDAEKVNSILKDKAKLQELLSSNEAKAFIKEFLKGK